jgi:hypothetical protein
MAMQKLSPGDSALLKAWVTERLTPLLDHDPGPAEYLSNYVMLIVDVSSNECIYLLQLTSPQLYAHAVGFCGNSCAALTSAYPVSRHV